MTQAFVCFNDAHDLAAVRWDKRPNDIPADAINRSLELLYKMSDLAPYVFVVWDGAIEVGLVIGGNFSPGVRNDGTVDPVAMAAEIKAVWSNILNDNSLVPQTGDFAPFIVEV